MSVRFTTATVASAAVAAVSVAAAALFSPDAPLHGGITYSRTLVVLVSIARGSSRVGRASAVLTVEIGDGRAASGPADGPGGVAASVPFAAASHAASADVEPLPRDTPAHRGITKVRTLAALDSLARGSSGVRCASAVLTTEIGDGRASSGAVVVVGGVTVSGRFATDAVAAVAVAAVELPSRDALARGRIT